MPLALPPDGLARAPLVRTSLAPTQLCRVSKRRTGEPYFGRSGANRFDDPRGVYGTSYFGLALQCAFAETILYDENGDDGFWLAIDALNRFVHGFEGDELVLADMTGPALKALGATGELSTVEPPAVAGSPFSRRTHHHRFFVAPFSFNCTAMVVWIFIHSRSRSSMRSLSTDCFQYTLPPDAARAGERCPRTAGSVTCVEPGRPSVGNAVLLMSVAP